MNIYAISDLHLSLFRPKVMDIFGDNWKNHWDKIKDDWLSKVSENDIVLIPGDISWAMKLSEARLDLNAICELPGKKIMLKGNHDYWWNSASQVKSMLFGNADIIQNNHLEIGDWAVCGTRGWIIPIDGELDVQDQKIYMREQCRLKLSLESAKKNLCRNIIVMMHYPPLFDNFTQTEFEKIISLYGVNEVVFGHLHGSILKQVKLRDYFHNGVRYNLVSADYLNFKLKLII